MDEIRQSDAVVCDQHVEVHIPDPVVLSGLDHAFNHVEFVPSNTSCGGRFKINIEIVAVFFGIICESKRLSQVTAVNGRKCEITYDLCSEGSDKCTTGTVS